MAGLSLASVTGGCSGERPSQAVLPPPPHLVDVTMNEYGFVYNKDIPAGRVVFTVTNVGRIAHRLSLLPLADDFPPIDVQIRGSERRFINPFAGIPAREPGERGTFAVELAPGVRYAMVCLLVDDQDNQSHALKGMTSEFRAGSGKSAPDSLPSPTPGD